MEGPEIGEEEEGRLMRNPEEIKRGLECGDCTECPYYWGNTDDHTPHCKEVEPDAIALIEDLQAKAPRWISVEESLPEAGTLVLCMGAKGGMFLGKFSFAIDGYPVYFHVPNAGNRRGAKYWMPLPEPPKEVQP